MKTPQYLVTLVNSPRKAQDWLNEVYEQGYELVSIIRVKLVSDLLIVAEFHSNERRSAYERLHQASNDEECQHDLVDEAGYCIACGAYEDGLRRVKR